MKINQQKLLHYVLIILMMFAPLRSVMAMQQTHCNNNMGGHMMSRNAVRNVDQAADQNVIDGTVESADSVGQMMVDMSMSVHSDGQKLTTSHDCCSGSSKCVGNCDMSVSTSLLMQTSFYTPNFTNVSASVVLTTDLINREFTPPFRPPLVFHS